MGKGQPLQRDLKLKILHDDYGNIFYCMQEFLDFKRDRIGAWELPLQKLLLHTTGIWPQHKKIKRPKPKRPKGYYKKLSTTVLDEIYPLVPDYHKYINREIYLLWCCDNTKCWRSKEFLKAVSTFACTPHNKRLYRTLKRLDAFK